MSREKSYRDTGGRIRLLRKRLGLSQKTFAEVLGIKQSWLSELETGLKKPSDVLLKGIEHRYAINHHWIILGTDAQHYPGKTFEEVLDQLLEKTKNAAYHSSDLPSIVAYSGFDDEFSKILERLPVLDKKQKREVRRFIDGLLLLAERDKKQKEG